MHKIYKADKEATCTKEQLQPMLDAGWSTKKETAQESKPTQTTAKKKTFAKKTSATE